MNIIICVDDRLGMLFNQRRLSSDKILNEHILALAAGGRLWMSPYTAKLFVPFEPEKSNSRIFREKMKIDNKEEKEDGFEKESSCGKKEAAVQNVKLDRVELGITEDILEHAGTGDYCFIEREDIIAFWPQVEKVILCHWNRLYPSDVQFDRTLLGNGWTGCVLEEFQGNSHDRITIEVYEK